MPSFLNIKRKIAWRGFVALAVAIGVGRFAFTPQLPVMQADLGLSLTTGGWLAGANYLGYLIGALLAGRSVASATMLMRWGLLAVVVSTIAMTLPGPLSWWLTMRFIAGVASAWVMVGTASTVLSQLTALPGAKYDGLVFAGVGAGIALVGLICHAGLLVGMSAAALWLTLACIALVGTVLVLKGDTHLSQQTHAAADATRHSPTDSDNSRHTQRWGIVLCYGLFGFGYILPATYLPSQARLLLQDPALFGWIWPIFGLAATLSTLSIAWLGRWPRRSIWALAQWIMVAGVLLPTLVAGLTGLALTALCVGGTFMLITLIGLQEARHLAGSHAQKWLAAMTAAFALGQLSGPLVASVLLESGASFNSALWLGACALIISNALLVCLSRK